MRNALHARFVSRPGVVAAAVRSGTCGSLLSTLALAGCGRLTAGTAPGPVNGPSQWVYGGSAAYRREASVRHTLLGYAIHHAMAIFWALPFEAVLARARPAAARRYRLAAALATAGIACFVDYRLTPRRLRPGFEKQLGRGSLALVYLAFGIGLGLGAGFREVPARSPASRIA